MSCYGDNNNNNYYLLLSYYFICDIRIEKQRQINLCNWYCNMNITNM